MRDWPSIASTAQNGGSGGQPADCGGGGLVIRLGGITSIDTSGRGAASARGEDVELVALRVGEARPRDVALAEVDVGGAESTQPGHLGLLIVTGVGPQVEVDAVLHGLHVRRAEELQVRADTRSGTQH